jgi:hypothetical protein
LAEEIHEQHPKLSFCQCLARVFERTGELAKRERLASRAKLRMSLGCANSC